MRRLRSLDDLDSWFRQPYIGTVETGAAKWWRLVQQRIPSVRTVVLRRDPVEVRDSMIRLGFRLEPEALLRSLRLADMKLDQIERRVPGVLSVRFGDIMTESGAAQVFEHCLGLPFDAGWFETIRSVNIQSDMRAMLRYMDAYMPELVKLSEVAKRHVLKEIWHPKVVRRDDVTIQQESCEVWDRDGKRLFEEHSLRLGESSDHYKKRNWPLMFSMDSLGSMQIMTARCNGRMVGYHVCYIGPATDEAGLMSALQISIFVTSGFTGLGHRLQRASIQALKDRGIGEINFRAGINADGPRMEAFYKRGGAEPIGMMYRLKLKEA
jgi:GNAT superfamily N-acetyltransferase